MKQKEIKIQTKHEAVTDVDKSKNAKEKKMQMECNSKIIFLILKILKILKFIKAKEKMQMECNSKSVRREMACCAALDRLE